MTNTTELRRALTTLLGGRNTVDLREPRGVKFSLGRVLRDCLAMADDLDQLRQEVRMLAGADETAESLHDDNQKLQARVAKLSDALRPFVDVGSGRRARAERGAYDQAARALESGREGRLK